MDDNTKKIGSTILTVAAAFAGVMLLLTLMDLLLTIFTADMVKSDKTGPMSSFLSFMKYSSVALAIMILAVVTGLVMGFFKKDKQLRIIILTIEGATILISIVFCIIASTFISYNNGNVVQTLLASITAFQSGLMQIIVVVAILLTASAIWYIPGFRKNEAQKKGPSGIQEDNAL